MIRISPGLNLGKTRLLDARGLPQSGDKPIANKSRFRGNLSLKA